VTDVTRRDLLAALAAAGLLTACGAPPTGAPPAATRTVTDPAGRRVDIPADPRRVVALDPNRVITDLVALGVVPVGATTNTANPGAGFAETLGPEAGGVVPVGTTGSADLERVAALTPDLILHATDYQEIPVDRLAAIAPVVTYPRAPTGPAGEVAYLDVQRAGGNIGVAGVRLALDDLAARRARGGA
jgi:iron complex transport system substrate-binding protein